jgi:hypothetical protein
MIMAPASAVLNESDFPVRRRSGNVSKKTNVMCFCWSVLHRIKKAVKPTSARPLGDDCS